MLCITGTSADCTNLGLMVRVQGSTVPVLMASVGVVNDNANRELLVGSEDQWNGTAVLCVVTMSASYLEE